MESFFSPNFKVYFYLRHFEIQTTKIKSENTPKEGKARMGWEAGDW